MGGCLCDEHAYIHLRSVFEIGSYFFFSLFRGVLGEVNRYPPFLPISHSYSIISERGSLLGAYRMGLGSSHLAEVEEEREGEGIGEVKYCLYLMRHGCIDSRA